MSSWHGNQLKAALGLGGLMSFYGIVTIIVILLPSTSVGSTQKIVVIVLVLLTLPFALLFMWLASRKKAKKEQKDATAKAGTPAANGQQQKVIAPSGTYSDLSTSAEEAVQFLKSSNLGESGRDAVYSLPWYIVAGSPKSGKSSLVLSSNLNFQTLPSQRQSEMKFIRPTGNIDWRVTSDAVFIDTAGRYQTEGIDGDEWAALLETVKKYRANRPLDGFILAVDTEKILKSDERELEEIAKVLRQRLDDAIQRIKVRFPVYLVFTHADAIEGFRDSFSSSKNEDKTLVWGATIPLEKSENAQALFDSEYEILQNSIMKRRLVRLSAPFPPVRQLRIFNFPLHFGSARRKFGAFVNALFRPNPFSENPFLRGFYFTASPAGKAGAGVPATVANGYFAERLFRDVVLRDKDLVRTFLAQRQRPPIFGWLLTLLCGFIVVVLLAMSAVSLWTNRQMLADAENRAKTVLDLRKSDAGKDLLAKNEKDTSNEIELIDNYRVLLAQLDEYERNGPPIYMRFGLYSGNRLYRETLLPIYFSMVEQRFKTTTVRKLESDLRKFADTAKVANPTQLTDDEEKYLGKHYDLLKAYLMLSGDYREKAEATHIASALGDYWTTESKVPANLKLTARQNLEFWSKQVDRQPGAGDFPRIRLDTKLVDDTRRKLQAFPPVYRYYSRKVTEISKEVDDKAGQTTVEAILTRNGSNTSFVDGTYSVPSAFTRAGLDLMKVAIQEADQKLSEDDWVMGETGKRDLAQATDAAKLEARYYRDYADHWRAFAKGVNVKTYKNKTEAENALQAFSQANSPIRILAIEIARNTNLSAPPENPGWIEWIKSFFSKGKKAEVGTTPPEKEFRPLFTFVGTKEKPEGAPIEKYQAAIAKVFNKFSGISDSKLKETAEAMANDKDPLDILKGEKDINGVLSGFNETPSSMEVAAMLQRPIGNLKSLLGAGAKDQLIKQWNEQVLPDAKAFENTYPFADSQNEADLAKLTAFLNPVDGKFSEFYKTRLSRYFEESNGELKQLEGAEIQFNPEFIAYLNSAMKLRTALFGTSPTPKFEYEFALKPVKDALIEVTIDGQKITSEGTGSIKGTFPAGGSAETGVIVMVSGTGSVSTPPSNTSTTGAPADSSAPSKTFQGNWGLFRFVDSSGASKQSGGEYLLNFSVGGKSVSATIKPSGGDLFDKSIFRQVKVPQSFVQ